ncbi:MAG: peptidoglycan DD-metalloendopeptidase family protein [Clostridia bacterium]|nr:peptidoglycan DD-metalloendopeptidase family protein [Clostridia bacterium]
MKNKLFRFFTLTMSLILMFNFVISSSAASKSELQDQLADIQAEREEQQNKLDSLKGNLDKQEEYVTTLYAQIEAIQKEIDIYQVKINELNGEVEKINKQIEAKNEEIAEIEVQMADKKEEIKEIKEMLAVRMRASYMSGSGSSLKLLLSADNLASYLTTSEMLKRIADNDDKIIKSLIKTMEDLLKLQEDLEKQKEELAKEKEALEVKKKELEAEQKVFTDRQTEVSLKYKEANAALLKLDKESQAYKNQIAALDRQESQLEQQIQNIIMGSNGSGGAGTNFAPSSNPSGYINPVPYSDRYISSVYGMRTNPVTGVYKLHAGIDISCGGAGGQTGPFTKQIVAAKAGTVSYAGWCSGYGNTVMITHSDGYLTLYAHNYTINVSVGQQVTQGQQIAIMGTTGNSTGAHCHFEIRNGMWGSTIDPAPYI